MDYFVVRLERGGPYDWTRGLREQDGFAEHGQFMDGLVDDGFILLGGPLDGVDDGRDTLHVVRAAGVDEIRQRFAADPWAGNGMVSVKSIERWTILLDGRS
jgi:uncharacterized protein YciI